MQNKYNILVKNEKKTTKTMLVYNNTPFGKIETKLH